MTTPQMPFADRLLIALAALFGLGGVAASAAAVHLTGGENLEIAGRFLLVHAAAVLAAIALVGSGMLAPRIGRAGAWTIVVGVGLFAGDLSLRALAGQPLFARAAPIGGLVLMGGWAVLALAALLPRRPPG